MTRHLPSSSKTSIGKCLIPEFKSVTQLLSSSSSPSECHLSFGDSHLDAVFQGGLYTGGVVEICGESASGKTQLCLQLCLSALSSCSSSFSTSSLSSNSKGICETPNVIYIATEDPFPSKRLQQLVQFSPITKSSRASSSSCSTNNTSTVDQITNNILVDHIGDFDQLLLCVRDKIPSLLNSRKVKLVVIDSVAAVFRSYEKENIKDRWKHLALLGKELHLLSGRNPGLCVLCVNQVTSVMNTSANNTSHSSDSSMLQGRQLAPSLGLSWANYVTTRFFLSRQNRTVRLHDDDDENGDKTTTTGASNECANECPRLRSWSATLRAIEVSLSPSLPNIRCDVIIDKAGFKGVP